MTTIRVTERAIAAVTLNGLQGNLARLGELQQQLSSGKLISRPSDSPTGTVQAMQFRSDIRVQQQYSRNADDGLAWLGTIDSTLTSAMTLIHRVRDLTVQGNSSGTGDTTQAREAIAQEIDNVRGTLIGTANTRYLNRPVFGGTTVGTAAFDDTGTYLGDAGSVNRTVGDGVSVRVDADGQAVFGTGTNGLFGVLSTISADLRSTPERLGADLDALDAATARVQSQLSDVGARYDRISQMKQLGDDRINDLKSQLSDVEDIDLPKTITELQLQQTAYQAALAATSKVVQPSLVDFLR